MKGFLGELIFRKISSLTKEGIPNVHFELTHDPNCPVCKGKVVIEEKKAVSSKEEMCIRDR